MEVGVEQTLGNSRESQFFLFSRTENPRSTANGTQWRENNRRDKRHLGISLGIPLVNFTLGMLGDQVVLETWGSN